MYLWSDYFLYNYTT